MNILNRKKFQYGLNLFISKFVNGLKVLNSQTPSLKYLFISKRSLRRNIIAKRSENERKFLNTCINSITRRAKTNLQKFRLNEFFVVNAKNAPKYLYC